jgi:CcmD family protein
MIRSVASFTGRFLVVPIVLWTLPLAAQEIPTVNPGVNLGLTSLFWAFAVVWVLHVGYLISIVMRQNGLKREIATLKALMEEKGRTPVAQ